MVVYADGELQYLESSPSTVGEILQEAGVVLAPKDRLYLDGVPISYADRLPRRDAFALQLLRAAEIVLSGQGVSTSALSVAQVLWDAGYLLRVSDHYDPGPESPVRDGLQIDYQQSTPLQVEVGGAVFATRSAAETVGEVLQGAGLPLQGLDYSLPEAGAPLPEDGRIRIVRVEEQVFLEQSSLPFESLLQPLPELEIDNLQVIQPGAVGLQVSRIRVRLEDGVEVARTTEAEWVAAEPKPRITGYGTLIVVRTLDTPDGPIEYWRAVKAFATSYSPCRLGTDFCGNTTASGLPLEKGMVGVIRPWYNAMVFSQVYVPGYGLGVIADIGAGVSGGHWIDLGYSDEDWVSWSQSVTIYFLTPVPPADLILWILP